MRSELGKITFDKTFEEIYKREDSEEAEAILARAQATSKGIAMVSEALKESGGVEVASLRVAEQYVQAFNNITKEGTTRLLPSSAANPANMMSQAMTMYKSLIENVTKDASTGGSSHQQSVTSQDDGIYGETSEMLDAPKKEHTQRLEPTFSLQSPRKGA